MPFGRRHMWELHKIGVQQQQKSHSLINNKYREQIAEGLGNLR